MLCSFFLFPGSFICRHCYTFLSIFYFCVLFLFVLIHFLVYFFCVGSLGHKYFTLVNNSPGTFYIGTQREVLKSGVTTNQVQVVGSPVLQQLRQNQFSFDMELCDGVAISTGSFVVADETAPKSGNLNVYRNSPSKIQIQSGYS